MLSGISDAEVEAPSYDTDWTIAQVASHLGSGVEVFTLFLEAGATGAPAPGIEQFQPVWDRWNAKTPLEQVRGCASADTAFLNQVAGLSDDQQASWTLDMFGTRQTLAGLLRMRLAEHALHSWDIEVALDSTATVPPDSAGLILGNLGFLVERVGKGAPEAVDVPVDVDVITTEPDQRLSLAVSRDGATLGAAGHASATRRELRLPAEAFVRLVYGRLDTEHTPASVVADGALLDILRAVFPGV
jgi:uncharacterized protein (TIGR03083 family)